jgi:hypothetical protein
MKATLANMKKYEGLPGLGMFDPETGEEWSATPGDYWNATDDDFFGMILLVKRTVYLDPNEA